MKFSEHKTITAEDCRAVAEEIRQVACAVEEDGDMRKFEEFFIEGGTEEGDAKIFQIRELLILRYAARLEKVE